MGYISDEGKAAQKQYIEQQLSKVRNSVTKWADKIVVGQYTGEPKGERKEGETWIDENGKQWIVKNGIKQSISQFQELKTPWWCPKCERGLIGKLNEKFYRLKGTCHDCWIVYEGKMRVDGVYPLYERRELRKNEMAWLRDEIQKHEDFIKNFRTQQHYSDGRWEELVPKEEFNETFDKLRADIVFMQQRMEQIKKDMTDDESEQLKLTEWERANPWTTTKSSDNTTDIISD